MKQPRRSSAKKEEARKAKKMARQVVVDHREMMKEDHKVKKTVVRKEAEVSIRRGMSQTKEVEVQEESWDVEKRKREEVVVEEDCCRCCG